MPPLSGIALENQGGVGTAEAKAVGHDTVQGDVFHQLAHDGHALGGRVGILHVGRGADEVVLHHEQGIDALIDARRAQGVAREGLGGIDIGQFIAKDRLDGAQFRDIAHWRTGSMGVDIVDWPI